MRFVLLSGRAPSGTGELALAPRTMDELHAHVGDVVHVGTGAGRTMRVVGTALLPTTSHTGYDTSAWMTADALQTVLPPDATADFTEDYVLVAWRRGANVVAAQRRLAGLAEFSGPAELPPAVVSLGEQRSLPFALAAFFALLASATVAHALVTTVRRRAHDLAVLRAVGFTRRNVRMAIAWQSTWLAVAGLVLGLPLGILAGRIAWRQLADNFPVFYAPPLAVIALVLIVPVAIAVVNVLAAAPARAATRDRPAQVLRAE
jgi:predicted lysophospholipase L1 biosynthesis ABC-type transport system permease subunit